MLVFHHDGRLDWTGQRPEDGFQQDVNLRLPGSKATFTMCLVGPKSADSTQRTPLSDTPPRRIPVVKSNLQKAIRRGEVHAALGSTAFFLRWEPQEVLRRLPIIAVEDVAMAEDLPKIVWLMAAAACGYVLHEQDELFVLSFAGSLARYPRKVEYDADSEEEEPLAWTESLLRTLQPVQFACVVRAAYGGMACDVELLGQAARSSTEGMMPAIVVEPNDYLRELLHREDLAIEHRLLPAVDFHCSDILSVIPTVPLEKAKKAMWLYWSGVNARCAIPEPPPWWEDALSDLQRFASAEWQKAPQPKPKAKPKAKKRGMENQASILRFVKRRITSETQDENPT